MAIDKLMEILKFISKEGFTGTIDIKFFEGGVRQVTKETRENIT